MEKNKINKELRLKIKEFMRYQYNQDESENDEEKNKILGFLPENLRNEFFIGSYKEIFLENPIFFLNFSKKALLATLKKGVLKEQNFFPGDVIFEVKIIIFFEFSTFS